MTEEQTTAQQTDTPGQNSGYRRLWQWTYRSALVLLIAFAVLLTGGRLMAPLIAVYQQDIEQQLGEMLGARVAIADIQGDWFRLGPIIDIAGLQIINPDNPAGSQVISRLFIKPDLAASILNGGLIIEQVIIEESQFRLTQDANGNWTQTGLASSDTDYTDTIVDFLLSTGRLQIVEADLVLNWADGRTLDLDNIYIDLSNSGSLHEVRIQARIAGQPSPFQVEATINGDPRDSFDARVHLNATQLELNALTNIPGMTIETARVSGDFWLTVQPGLLYDLQASVESFTLAGTGATDNTINAINLANAGFEFSLRHGEENRWQAWLENADFDWYSRPWSVEGLYLELRNLESTQPLDIRAAGIDLAMARDVLDDLFALPERAAAALSDLDPDGKLENLKITTDLNGTMDGGFLLQANLADVAVGAWQGAPAGRGIQGYVQANSNAGFVELDSSAFEIHLPRLFAESWSYASANSRVHWKVEDDNFRVNSSVIDVSNDFIHGHVQFDFYNHLDAGGEPQSELILLIGILELDAGYKSLYLPMLDNIRNTMNWLDEALLAGSITNSGFVSRTSTIRNEEVNSGTVMSFYNVTGGRFKFQPQWPELAKINAFVNQDNNAVDVIAESAEIEGITLGQTSATVRPAPEGGSWLAVQGSATTTTQLGMAFLRNTPVRDDIGDFIDGWRGEGSVQVDINLGIPLNNPARETDVLVNVDSNMSTLTIPEYSLSIDELRGRVVYDSDMGLSASALSGRLFDLPIAATIEPMQMTAEDGSTMITGTRIVGSGRASNSALQSWAGQPQFVRDVLNFASGEIDYLAEFTIPYAGGPAQEEGTSLRLSSELLGLALDLPHPFGKSVENIRPLNLLIDFSDREQWISLRFDNQVGANVHIAGDNFAGGRVQFGQEVSAMTFGPVALEDQQRLVFNGSLDRFDYNAWEDTATRFAELSTAGTAGGGLEDYIALANVNVGRFNVLGQELENVQTYVRRVENAETAGADSWLVNLENELLSGAFTFPDDETLPWIITLDYLRFPETDEEDSGDEETEEIDILADIDPAALPDLDFTTTELGVGDKQLGAWEFQLRTNGNSATISNLKMTTADARISDVSGEAGANLDWRYLDGMHTSSFTGLFSAGDLAQVLPGWGYNANVESNSAAFISNLQWSGSPAAFSLDKVFGNVELEIRDGRFVDVDSGTSRLFGAFTFDSLVRRLELDFSDLYERGLAYDRIAGHLVFDRGIVRNEGPFEINGPSSRITINGEINLANETIDADMLVNVPLGQNLSVLAGILGAWPIAVSTYIASRIFQDQMDDFTTVLYRLEGPWENPTSGFEPTGEILEADPVEESVEEEAAAGGNTPAR